MSGRISGSTFFGTWFRDEAWIHVHAGLAGRPAWYCFTVRRALEVDADTAQRVTADSPQRLPDGMDGPVFLTVVQVVDQSRRVMQRLSSSPVLGLIQVVPLDACRLPRRYERQGIEDLPDGPRDPHAELRDDLADAITVAQSLRVEFVGKFTGAHFVEGGYGLVRVWGFGIGPAYL